MYVEVSQIEYEACKPQLLRNAAFNLFILGNCEQFELGTLSKLYRVWDPALATEATYVQVYRSHITIDYAANPALATSIAQALPSWLSDEQRSIMNINAHPAMAQALQNLGVLPHQHTYQLASLQPEWLMPADAPNVVGTLDLQQLRTTQAFEELLHLFNAAGMGRLQANNPVELQRFIDGKLEALAHGIPTLGLYCDGQLVCSAALSMLSSAGTMLIGVATRPDMQQRGLASYLVHEICRYAFEHEQRQVALYFNNPQAARIYHRLGFRDLGPYVSLMPTMRT